MTVSIYLVLAILILVWSLVSGSHLTCCCEPAWPSLSYPGHSHLPQGFSQSASLSQISMMAPLHHHPALPRSVALL
ncbi:hypothetical protein C8Q74DRAFT_1243597 [Fomes fomentarius]|nr:hypothetical protein C8Q74DRAFT_1243597 [Fomes fomentarius]